MRLRYFVQGTILLTLQNLFPLQIAKVKNARYLISRNAFFSILLYGIIIFFRNAGVPEPPSFGDLGCLSQVFRDGSANITASQFFPPTQKGKLYF